MSSKKTNKKQKNFVIHEHTVSEFERMCKENGYGGSEMVEGLMQLCLRLGSDDRASIYALYHQSVAEHLIGKKSDVVQRLRSAAEDQLAGKKSSEE